MSDPDDLIGHFEAHNQEGAEQPVIPASRLPRTRLPHSDQDSSKQFLDHLLRNIGDPAAGPFERTPRRGWDDDYQPSLHRQLRDKQDRNTVRRALDEDAPPDSGQGHAFVLRSDAAPEEVARMADQVHRMLDSGDREEREIEHGLPERLGPAGVVHTVHPMSDLEGFLRDRWHLRSAPWAAPLPEGSVRPSNKWVRKTWKAKVGPLACEHEGCPPWEHREPHEASAAPDVVGHFDEAPARQVTASWDSSGSDSTGVYLRFGHWPDDERSFSPAGGYREDGVSAYDLDQHGSPAIDHGLNRRHEHDSECDVDEFGTCEHSGDPWHNPDNDPREEMQGRVQRAEKNRRYGADKPGETAHLVRGTMAGIGYDGEPLLQNVRRVGDWIDHRHLFIPGAKPHRLARDPEDDDYEPPEETPLTIHHEASASPGGEAPWADEDDGDIDEGTETYGGLPIEHPDDTPYHDDAVMRRGRKERTTIRPSEQMSTIQAWLTKGNLDYLDADHSRLYDEDDPVQVLHDHATGQRYLLNGNHKVTVARTRGLDRPMPAIVTHVNERHEASSRPGRGERQCPCCKGTGSHGSDPCDACDGDGNVGRSDQVEHCPGQPQPRRRHWREAAMPAPDYDPAAELPVGRGIWYRAHLKGQPLDEAHARSRTLNRPWPGSPGSDHPAASSIGQSGYSAFAHPQHLSDYMHEYGWADEPEVGWDDREVVAFHGTQVGRGADNEPLVRPAPNPACCGNVIHSRTPWEEFEEKLPGAEPLHPRAVPPWKTMFAPEPTPRSKSVRRHYQDETDRVNRQKRQERHQEGRQAMGVAGADGHQLMSIEDLLELHSNEALARKRHFSGDRYAEHGDDTKVRTVYDRKAADIASNPAAWGQLDEPIRDGTIDPVLLELKGSGHTVVTEGQHRIVRAHQLGVSHLPVSYRPDSQVHRYDWEDPEPLEDGERTASLVGHFEAAAGEDYRMQHTAPSPAAGHLPLNHYEGGHPDDLVRVYRSAPPGTEAINPGDWISLSADYAHQHGRHATDSSKDWPAYTAEVPQKHVHWDENDESEHGYNGPAVHHPDVHDEETGQLHDWGAWHDAHPHGQEAWAGAAVHLPQEQHELVHDDCEWEPDRATTLLDAARQQGALRSARWRDDLYPAREDAEAHAGLVQPPDGHRVTAFTIHRGDDGRPEDVAVHHFEPGYDGLRRYDNASLEGHRYRHPAIGEVGQGRQAGAREGSMQHSGISGETAPDEGEVWASPSGRGPVAEHYLHVMKHPGESGGGSSWVHPHVTAPYHGPYYIASDPEAAGDNWNMKYHVLDREGRSTTPHYYGGPAGRHGGFNGALKDWHTLTTRTNPEGRDDDPAEVHEAYIRQLQATPPRFPHSRVDPHDLEILGRPDARVHKPEGHSPQDEWHGPYEVVRHPETGNFHVIDNAGRHAPGPAMLSIKGFPTQLAAERSRDHVDRKQQSRERASGIAKGIYEGFHEAVDPGGTEESRESERNLGAGEDLMGRYAGGRGQVKFEPDEQGGRPYYHREHYLPGGEQSGWYAKHYGGPSAEMYHHATGDETAHDIIRFPVHPEDAGSMTPRLHPDFGDSDLARHMQDWHDGDEDLNYRRDLEAQDPRISAWRRRRQASLPAGGDLIAHFDGPGTAAQAGDEAPRAKRWYHGTRWELNPGQQLEGGRFPSNQGYGQPGDHVYYSGRPSIAAFFAQAGSGPEEDDWEGTPRVYQVDPDETHERDPDEDESADSWRASGARVVREVPWMDHWGRQGSLEPADDEEGPGHVASNSDARRFFHGTSGSYSFQPGDILTPGAQPTVIGGRAGHVYYTSDLASARTYAGYGQPLKADGRADFDAEALPGHVYEVIPETAAGKRIGRHAEDPYSGVPGNQEAYRTKGRLRVLHEVDKETGEPIAGAGHEVVAHFGQQPRGKPQQLKLFHMQPDPTLRDPASGRHNPDEPLAHALWRDEHDPEYTYHPDECEHCGGDRNFPDAHAEQHDQWLTSQDWYTDWDHEHPGDTLHRGIGMDLPDEVHRVVHDESRPVRERAHALLSHVLSDENAGGSGLGNFWSDHSGVAKVYAEGAAQRYGRSNVQTPVMLHVHFPGMEHVETDPDELQHWGVYSYHLAGNREVPISHGAPLRVKGISWAPPGHQRDAGKRDEPPRLEDDPAWAHHEVGGEGIRATASGMLGSNHADEQRAALEALAHFGDDEDDPGEDDYRDDEDEDDEDAESDQDRRDAEEEARVNAALPYVEHPRDGEVLDHLTHLHGVDPQTFDLHLSPKNQERWHAQEHAHRSWRYPKAGEVPHQHDQRRGVPGEAHWPDAFQLSEHTDFAGGTPAAGRFERVLSDPAASGTFAPLMPSESALRLPAAAGDGVVAHFEAPEGSNPPCRYCGEALDDDDVRDGQSAHEECSDMRWCEPHQEHHDDPAEAEDHNETYTDWGHYLPFAGGIHRGLTVRLPGDVHAIVHDDSQPSAQRALAMARHLHGSSLGVHWTDSEDIARAWGSGEGAMFGPSQEERSDPSWTHLVVHAASPDEEHVETDPAVLSGRNMLGFGHARSEREVPLRDDAPVRVTGFSWKPASHAEWQRHDLPGPVAHSAALEATAAGAPDIRGRRPAMGNAQMDAYTLGHGNLTWQHGEHSSIGRCDDCGATAVVGEPSDEERKAAGFPSEISDSSLIYRMPGHSTGNFWSAERPVMHNHMTDIIKHLEEDHGEPGAGDRIRGQMEESQREYARIEEDGRQRWNAAHPDQADPHPVHPRPVDPADLLWHAHEEHNDMHGIGMVHGQPGWHDHRMGNESPGPTAPGRVFDQLRKGGIEPGQLAAEGSRAELPSSGAGESVVAHFAVGSGHMDKNGFHWDPEHDDGEVHLAPPYAGQQLYHGTRSDLEQGQMLTPGDAARHPSHPMPDDGREYVHATPHYSEARYWGQHADAGEAERRAIETGRQRQRSYPNQPDHDLYRPRVYEVHPTGEVMPDPNGEGQSYRSAHPMRVGREVWPVQCHECEQEHEPGHSHYDWSRGQDEEEEREEAVPDGQGSEQAELAVHAEPPAGDHPDDPAALAEGDAMEAHLRQSHRYDDADLSVVTSRANNPLGRRNSLNSAHRGDHAVSGFDHPHPHPPLTVNRRPDGGPTIPMMDTLRAQMAEHRWRNEATACEAGLSAREGSWTEAAWEGSEEDPDRYVRCDQGHQHWGANGAAGMLIRHHGDDGHVRYLLQRRSPYVQHGSTWSTPGGALANGETPEQGAWREAEEELGPLPGDITHHHTHADDHGSWAYHTVVADSPRMFEPSGGHPDADWESSGHRWVTAEEMRGLPLHPGFAASWEGVRKSGALEPAGDGTPSFTWSYETYGPTGYEPREEVVRGPFYHGGRASLGPGGLITPGRKPNEWGDEFDEHGRSVHAYFSNSQDTAASYAQALGPRGHLYEVEPTGPVTWDSRGGDGAWRSEHPLRVIRRIPRREWQRKAGQLVIASAITDQVAIPAAPARTPVISMGAWLPETAEDAEQMAREFPGFLSALHEGLEALAMRLDEQPVDEEIPAIIRRMAIACLTAAEDVARLVPPLPGESPEGTWDGPKELEAPKD